MSVINFGHILGRVTSVCSGSAAIPEKLMGGAPLPLARVKEEGKYPSVARVKYLTEFMVPTKTEHEHLNP